MKRSISHEIASFYNHISTVDYKICSPSINYYILRNVNIVTSYTAELPCMPDHKNHLRHLLKLKFPRIQL